MKYTQRTKENYNEDFLLNLLKDRKIIENQAELDSFISPNPEMQCSPYDLDNIELAAEKLVEHLEKGSRIFIPVDPDADGYTSAAALFNYLTLLKADYNIELDYNIPNEKSHGFESIFNELKERKKYDLIIMADGGSNDSRYHQELCEEGYDIIILDHHIMDDYNAFAIIVNNQKSERYINKELTGVGVVYQFLRVLDDVLGVFYADTYLDLVAVGIISDMGHVTTKENRYLIDKGLKSIKNDGLKAMIEKQTYSIGDINNLTPTNIAFYIAPLINALIRVGTPLEKEILFKSLICGAGRVESTKRGAKGETETIATQNARNCVNARARQNREKEKAMELLEIQVFNEELDNNKILILNGDELVCSNSLTGLVAMGMAAKKKLPTMLGRTTSDGYFRGSIRGLNESELKDFRGFLLDSGLLEYAQGHANACGFSLKKNNISKLLDYANKELKDINFNEGFYEVDFIKNANESNLDVMIKELGAATKLWGQNCPEPLIVINNLFIEKNNIQVIGKNQDTMKFEFNGVTYVKFKAEKIIDKIGTLKGKLICNVVGKANLNLWCGRTTPQLFIEDIEVREDNSMDF